jgi:hypothetical protein
MTVDLGALGLEVRTHGRAALPLVANVVRELAEADVALLSIERGIKAPPLKSPKTVHHTLARLLAGGVKNADAAVIVGLSISRISILRADPMFQNLMAFYAENDKVAFADIEARRTGLSVDVLEELHRRLEADPEDFTKSELTDLFKAITPKAAAQTNVQVNVDLAERLQRGHERVRQFKEVEAQGYASPAVSSGPDEEPVL